MALDRPVMFFVAAGVLLGSLGVAATVRSSDIAAQVADRKPSVAALPAGQIVPGDTSRSVLPGQTVATVAFETGDVPPNPFTPLPVERAAPPAKGPVTASAPALKLPPANWGAAAPAVPQAPAPAQPATQKPMSAAPTPAPAPAPPAPEVPKLKGIIHGQPAIAMAVSNGQTYFLKQGDRLDDGWQLVEIKEGSVVFRLGDRLAEVRMEGGSSR